ncbi:helix-turn-helix domain-containing protein [Salinicola halophilus]|uniref:helix-turn-helix domain-containing protein n=1 Tax=Salinicola halophilus TaxID=184065 RepID=UPI001EF81ECC|nr:XRE family transcriptional regulator [Salinicola halophilus]
MDKTMQTDRAAIGQRLRSLRRDREWSLDRLAAEAGVSKAMLGQIERGESMPTVSTLWKVAGALRAPLSHFLASTTLPATVSPREWLHDSAGMAVQPLFAFDPTLGFEMFVIDLQPGGMSESAPHTAGVIEHVVVVEGEMALFIEGEWQTLAAGEGRRFAADQPHAYRNDGLRSARFHDLIHYPGPNR